MRKLIAVCLLLCLVLSFGAALAEEPIAVKITPLDYQTGKPVSKTYVENELFLLRVDIDIARFADLSNLQLIIETDGVDVEDQDVQLMDGTYYITGVVTDQPATITVKIADIAYDNAQTAEDLYNALRQNRTVYDSYRFFSTVSDSAIYIPKTGDAPILAPIMAILACAGLCRPRRRK